MAHTDCRSCVSDCSGHDSFADAKEKRPAPRLGHYAPRNRILNAVRLKTWVIVGASVLCMVWLFIRALPMADFYYPVSAKQTAEDVYIANRSLLIEIISTVVVAVALWFIPPRRPNVPH